VRESAGRKRRDRVSKVSERERREETDRGGGLALSISGISGIYYRVIGRR